MTEESEKLKKKKLPILKMPSRTDCFLFALTFVNLIVVYAGVATTVTIFAMSYCLVALGISVTMKLFWNDFAKRKNAGVKQNSSFFR